MSFAGCAPPAAPRAARPAPCQGPFPAGPLRHDEQRPEPPVWSGSCWSCCRPVVPPTTSSRSPPQQPGRRETLDKVASGAPRSRRPAGDLRLPGRHCPMGAGVCQHASCGQRAADRALRATVRPVLPGETAQGSASPPRAVSRTVRGSFEFSRDDWGLSSFFCTSTRGFRGAVF